MLIKLPFSGFYCSIHDKLIDYAIESIFSDDNGDSHVPDDFFLHYDSTAICLEYCKMFVECVQTYLYDELDLDITLTFHSMTSPRFYNFETDKIYCEISVKDVHKLYGYSMLHGNLAEIAKRRHTSRSGFISFYDPDITNAEAWPGVDDWDCNQLETLLLSVCDYDDFEALENNWNYNEEIQHIVDNNLSTKCSDMASQFYDAVFSNTYYMSLV